MLDEEVEEHVTPEMLERPAAYCIDALLRIVGAQQVAGGLGQQAEVTGPVENRACLRSASGCLGLCGCRSPVLGSSFPRTAGRTERP